MTYSKSLRAETQLYQQRPISQEAQQDPSLQEAYTNDGNKIIDIDTNNDLVSNKVHIVDESVI